MSYYIESAHTNPHHNLALEQFVFDKLDRANNYFMLLQNHNSIIVGKHQNTVEEINAAFVKEKNITVARRLSGGGAVYHDLGNLNFTFVTDADGASGIEFYDASIVDFSFNKPVLLSDYLNFSEISFLNIEYIKNSSKSIYICIFASPKITKIIE
jgi:lipoate-protein ligase A